MEASQCQREAENAVLDAQHAIANTCFLDVLFIRNGTVNKEHP